MRRTTIVVAASLPVLALLAFFAHLVRAAEPWTNGQDASIVIGQPDFVSAGAGASATSLFSPKDVAIDAEHGKIYVLDAFNNRILRYTYPFTSPQPTAELVFGQPDFTSSGTGASQQNFNQPRGMALDDSGRLWVGEYSNNRVVWFDEAYAINGSQPPADGVLGQPDFDSSAAATTESGMRQVYDLAVDAAGTLFVADAGNHRVLRFDNAAAKANGAPADGVLGQPDFVSMASATTASSMNAPRGVALWGTTLFVADRSNSRVLRFDDAAAKANGAGADGVLGQPDFTSNAQATTQSGMSNVGRVLVDGAGRLYVSDIFGNERILIFNDAATLPNGAPADYVLGQPDFTSSGPATAQNRINADSSGAGMAIDHENNRFFFADDQNNRVLGFGAEEPLTFPIISIAKEGPSHVLVNDLITYTLTITNSGSAPATSLVITDVLPANVEYVDGGALGAGGVVSWNLADLANGAQAQVQFAVRATQLVTITNGAYGVSFGEGDTVLGAEDVVTEVEGYPVLEIGKTAPATALVGDLITYTLTVTNSGWTPATSLLVTDTLPTGVEYVVGGTLGAGNVVSWNVAGLAVGAQTQVQFTVRATDVGPITNDAYGVSFAEGDTVLGTEPVVTTIEGEALLSIAKGGPATVMANELITYTLTVTNSGSLTATSLVISDVLPGGAEYVSGGALGAGNVVSWTVDSLAAGDQVSVQFAVRATESITNDTYAVSFAEGDTVTGVDAVVTTVRWWTYYVPHLFN